MSVSQRPQRGKSDVDKRTIYYDGFRFVRSALGYYWGHTTGDRTKIVLSRYIWQKHNGLIPPKHHIHHKDHDKENNNIENLELISASEHVSHHMLTEERRSLSKKSIIKAIAAAPKWHSSKEGIEWHRKQGQETWNRKPRKVKCEHCKKEYFSKKPGRFCSVICRNNFQRQCAICDKKFTFYQSAARSTIYCSLSCSTARRKTHDGIEIKTDLQS